MIAVKFYYWGLWQEVMVLKRAVTVFLFILFLMISSAATADRVPPVRTFRYIGAMRVVKCEEYVTLRAEPYKKSRALAKVPLGAIVYNCSRIKQKTSFVSCEYEGMQGYILVKYLEEAPEYEPAVTSATTRKMTMEEVIGEGEVVLDWKDYNISVVAAHEFVEEDKNVTIEILRIGCFIDGRPLWGHIETLEVFGELPMLKAFIAGNEDDPAVMIYDGGYGLSMLDLLSGSEKWTLPIGNCNLGDAAAVAVSENGNMYIAGTEGPDPVAITQEGRVIWTSETDDPDIYAPYEIVLNEDIIEVRYKSGMADGYMLASFDYTGELLDIREKKAN